MRDDAERLNGADLRAILKIYRDALRLHQDSINALNVYPVPDGDTGTNMALTVESVVAELAGVGDEMAAVCKAMAHGSLMGARGNSGVILSQILRGIADAFGEYEHADNRRFVGALRSASDLSYEAVMKPVEGTILTVVRRAAEAAEAALETSSNDLASVVTAAHDAAAIALEETPEQLAVLAEAGVVDAGGAGFVLFLDATLHHLIGRPLPQPSVAAGPAPVVLPHAGHGPDEVGDLRYEVMFLLEADDDAIAAFKHVWAGIGDSIVVVGGDGLWNCHIHTDDIGPAVEAGIDIGRPRDIRITDLAEQVIEERWVREAAKMMEAPGAQREHVPTAVVAVSPADGISRIFHSLGAQEIVAGGQTMNPSMADVLEAIERAPGDAVVVLPNNTNITPVARQAQAASSKPVVVVDTAGVAEAFASLLAYDPLQDVDDNAAAMAATASATTIGEVTQAVRESVSEAGPIAAGDWLGLDRGGIRVVAGGAADAAIALLDILVGDGHEIVTIIEGDDATVPETRAITEWLADKRPGVEAETHHGGQPHYPYLFGVE